MAPASCCYPLLRCIKFCNDAKLLEKFRESAKLLDMVQKGLSDYLETKRAGFSRFYFLSNDELLEILSQTKVTAHRCPPVYFAVQRPVSDLTNKLTAPAPASAPAD